MQTKSTARCAGTVRGNGAAATWITGSSTVAKHPDAVARNREKQKARDTRQHLRDLANNTSALDLKHSAAAVWLLNGQAADLANNNSVSAQVWIIEALPRRKGPGSESCKQQPAGTFSAFAG
jgi:hypothetical protein